MQIIIKETGAIENLEFIDYKTNVNYVEDFIGMNAGFDDPAWSYNEVTQQYTCDQETFDWWAKVINEHQALEDLIDDLKDELDDETVDNALGDIDRSQTTELDNFAITMIKGLTEEFPKHSKYFHERWDGKFK